MQGTPWAAVLAVLLAPAAWSAELTDKGPNLANDPYEGNTALTTGRIAGFRTLYGDPDALASALAPSVATGGRADLPLVNDRASWAEVTVGGQKIGVMGPYGQAVVSNVPAGDYAWTMTFPTGFVLTGTATTVSDLPPAPNPPDPRVHLPPVPQDAPPEPVTP